jgi:Ni/Co efflux regulator RcnB
VSSPRRRIAKRSLRNTATVEQYLQAGVVPRFIERAQQIESETRRHRQRLQRAYEWTREQHPNDPEEFRRHWTEIAETWRFDEVNELIDEHNRWYPAERRLPLNPRTGDYVTIGNRDWRRYPLNAAWILRQFRAS